MTRRVRCIYCGRWVKTNRYPPTCGSHRELVRADPHYREARLLEAETHDA